MENNKKSLLLVICILIAILGAGILVYYLTANNNSVIINASNVSADIEETSFDSSDEYYITLSESITISKSGVYYISGSLGDGSITINTNGSVKLVLNDVSITSSNGPAINVENASVLYVESSGFNSLSATVSDEANGTIYSTCDIVLLGSGSLTIKSNMSGIKSKGNILIENGTYEINTTEDGIHSNDSVKITGGTINIKSSDDGIHANDVLEINDGKISVNAAEGLEATYVKINGGTINISASDDGINAAQKSDDYTPTVEINGGYITITMGQGDTDGVDSNGNIIINGGTISVTGQSTFDYDGTGTINGGTVICNGEKVSTLPNQFGGQMGGGMQGGQQMTPPNQNGTQGGGQMTPPDQSNNQQTRTRSSKQNNV